MVRSSQAKLKGAGTRLWAIVLVLWVCGWVGKAAAAEIDIPEEPLSSALLEIGRQTGENILFTLDTVAGLRAHAVKGQMTAQQAIERLLQGTGIVAVPDGDRGLLVQRPAAQSAKVSALPGLQVTSVALVPRFSRIFPCIWAESGPRPVISGLPPPPFSSLGITLAEIFHL
jgi:hypothetical protein